VVTDEFLHDVIAHPNSKPVPGFGPIMPPTIDAGLIKEEEVPDLIAYINKLSDKGHRPATLPSTVPTTAPASQP
jgi:hypothetical protein